MKKIKMIETMPGYPDGIKKQMYDKGCIYEAPDGIADAFLSAGAAENVLEISSVDPAEIETPETPPEPVVIPDEFVTPENPKKKGEKAE